MNDEARVASGFNTVRGRILGLIESFGLPERQEQGCKATFKSLTYDLEADMKALIQEIIDREKPA